MKLIWNWMDNRMSAARMAAREIFEDLESEINLDNNNDGVSDYWINGGVNGGINQEINGQHPNASSGIPRFGMGFDGDGQQQNTSSRSSRPNSNIGSHKKRDPFDSLFDANM